MRDPASALDLLPVKNPCPPLSGPLVGIYNYPRKGLNIPGTLCVDPQLSQGSGLYLKRAHLRNAKRIYVVPPIISQSLHHAHLRAVRMWQAERAHAALGLLLLHVPELPPRLVGFSGAGDLEVAVVSSGAALYAPSSTRKPGGALSAGPLAQFAGAISWRSLLGQQAGAVPKGPHLPAPLPRTCPRPCPAPAAGRPAAAPPTKTASAVCASLLPHPHTPPSPEQKGSGGVARQVVPQVLIHARPAWAPAGASGPSQ